MAHSSKKGMLLKQTSILITVIWQPQVRFTLDLYPILAGWFLGKIMIKKDFVAAQSKLLRMSAWVNHWENAVDFNIASTEFSRVSIGKEVKIILVYEDIHRRAWHCVIDRFVLLCHSPVAGKAGTMELDPIQSQCICLFFLGPVMMNYEDING